MTNVIEFPKKQYQIRFAIPNCKVIQVRKTSDDYIKIEYDENGGIAHTEAINLYHAQDIVKRILPDIVIIDDSEYPS